MKSGGRRAVVLHIEDDQSIKLLVKLAFRDLGFQGRLISLSGVKETLAFIQNGEENPVDLILLEMELPDGTGLDVIRAVKNDMRWRLTPVIVLSNTSDADVVDAAYALGASCFLPKMPPTGAVLENLQTLYQCWLESAVFPRTPEMDRLQGALARSVKIRARTADLYLCAARKCKMNSDVSFWVERALNEGNMSNLLAFVQPLVSDSDAPADLVDRLVAMQDRVEAALQQAEKLLQKAKPLEIPHLCLMALDLFGAVDESTTAETLKCLFSLSPQVISSLKKHAAAHLGALSRYILERTDNMELHERAKRLQMWAEDME